MSKNHPQLWTAQALAVEFGVSAKQIDKALEEVPTDGRVDGELAWYLATVVTFLYGANEISYYQTNARQEACRCMVRILSVMRNIPDEIANLGADDNMVSAARDAIKEAEERAVEDIAHFNQEDPDQ